MATDDKTERLMDRAFAYFLIVVTSWLVLMLVVFTVALIVYATTGNCTLFCSS